MTKRKEKRIIHTGCRIVHAVVVFSSFDVSVTISERHVLHTNKYSFDLAPYFYPYHVTPRSISIDNPPLI